MSRHVCIIIANLPGERDRRVIRQCQTLEERGYEVTVIAPKGDPALRILPGTARTRLKPYPVKVYGAGVITYAIEFVWSFLCIAFLLGGEVLRGRAHGVQVCNPPDVYWPLALLIRLIGRVWIFDHHDLCPEVYATRSAGNPNRWAFRVLVAFEWLTLRTATAVIATNESFRENAQIRGVSAKRITVVRNGPRQAEIAPGATVDRPDREPAPERPLHHLVYLGVLGPQDNVAGAVLAAAELANRRGRDDWRLTIAGDGESLDSLTKLVSDRGLGDVVEFAGWLDGSAVDELLRNAAVGIQPDLRTRMNDLSTMAKTVEYLGRGVPVVAVDLTETRRSAADAAVYVPTGSPAEFAAAIDELLDDEPRRARMRAHGLARFAELLAWDRQAEAYIGVWGRLLPLPAPATHPEVVRQRTGEQGDGSGQGALAASADNVTNG